MSEHHLLAGPARQAPADPLTYLGAALLLGGVAVLASFIPAARATRIQPIAVLRNE